MINNFNKYIFVVFLLLFSVAIYGEEPDLNERLNSNIPIDGDLRFIGNLTVSLKDRYRISWRGTFDYYLTNYWSLTGSAHLNFNKIEEVRYHTGALGLNLHPFYLGNIDFFGGGSAGYTWVAHDSFKDKLVPTVVYRLGMSIHGTIFCITGEVLFRDAMYYSGNNTLDLREVFLSGGIGFKM